MGFQIENQTAILTGAASGIGAALAMALSKQGVHLILVDREETGLAEIAAQVHDRGVRCATYTADLSGARSVEKLINDIQRNHRKISILINNAGMALFGRFNQINEAEFQKVLAVNLNAPIQLVRAFLPMLENEPKAQIVNVSSLFGLLAARGQVAYCTSKFGLRGFSEALRLDLSETNVGVTSVHPGGVKTNIARSATIAQGADAEFDHKQHAERFLRFSANEAADEIVQAIRRRRKRVVFGQDARVMTFLQRMWPTSYQRLMLLGSKKS